MNEYKIIINNNNNNNNNKMSEKRLIRAIGVSGFTMRELTILNKHKLKHIPLGVVRGWHDPLRKDWLVIEWCKHEQVVIMFNSFGSKIANSIFSDYNNNYNKRLK
ncbi:hypothetical protein RFI_03919 [Reticulomyxa filosa]|uniref:Uncharacterized protein n=1 Tax=Reticulomyxa filosa TaxID=46433 RepID=X6P4Q2_RETFI|nr:hypothetical protein RFI_03919 [Reticulomyxa filosa]|eukprot:ETO33186.1 hypothetical protein RFI_03919 [Reticulomyxa filosa]